MLAHFFLLKTSVFQHFSSNFLVFSWKLKQYHNIDHFNWLGLVLFCRQPKKMHHKRDFRAGKWHCLPYPRHDHSRISPIMIPENAIKTNRLAQSCHFSCSIWISTFDIFLLHIYGMLWKRNTVIITPFHFILA